MRRYLLLALLFATTQVFAERVELDDGSYVDDEDEIHSNKYENEDIFAPWNDPLKKNDPFAPWNDPLQQDDPFAPWNDPMADKKETNRYLRKQGEKDSDYYWE